SVFRQPHRHARAEEKPSDPANGDPDLAVADQDQDLIVLEGNDRLVVLVELDRDQFTRRHVTSSWRDGLCPSRQNPCPDAKFVNTPVLLTTGVVRYLLRRPLVLVFLVPPGPDLRRA